MNRKFCLGLSLVIIGASSFGAASAYIINTILQARKTKRENSPSISADEMIAMLKASSIVMDKARDGAYDDVVDKDAAIRSDYEFYKMTLLMGD
jgi:hypothetical protein